VKNGIPVYDTHTHIGIARHSGRVFSAADMLRHMDRCGVDRSLLIPYPVVEDHRAAHDEIGRAVQDHPDRFTGCACLYPYVPLDTFRDELRRCIERYNFRALKLQPQYHGLNPVSPRSDFYFEAALEHRLPIVVHTGAGAPFALPSLYIHPARRFPELRIVLGHGGGSVYFAECIVAATVCPNIYIELSSLMPHHIHEILAQVPTSRLMAGSDLPSSVETEIGKIFTLDLPEEGKRDILWTTPRRLFDGAEA
jgi:predicted TIM-barrel fold metal-dependent hydrolase